MLAAIAALLPTIISAKVPTAASSADPPRAAERAFAPAPIVESPRAADGDAEADAAPPPQPEPLSFVKRPGTWPSHPSGPSPLLHGDAAPATATDEESGGAPDGTAANVAGLEDAAPESSASKRAPADTEATPEAEPREPPKIDPTAAAQALRAAAARAAGCGGGTTAHVRVAVTFAPSGRATSAVVSDASPIAGTLIGSCVAGHLRGVSIPAFAGDPVTFVRTVTIR